MYILMDYHTTCEVCGKRIDGVIARHFANNDSALLGNIINDMASSVDATNARKALENQVEEKKWSSLNFSNGASGRRCPYCGAHQSWEELSEPVAPENPENKASGKIKSAIIGGIICGIIGMIIGLFVMIFTDTIGLIISSAIGVVLGVLIGLWANKALKKDEIEAYPKKLEKYQQSVNEYNEYTESLKTRTEKFEPEVDIKSARVNRKSDDDTEAEWKALVGMM